MTEVKVELACPECGTLIPVPINVEIHHDSMGAQYLSAEPSMDDLWAHAWSHGDPTPQP